MRQIFTELYIDGQRIKSRGATTPVINPADESVIGEAPIATQSEVEQAIAAAREAFDHGPWPRMTTRERVARLELFLNDLRENKNDIVNLIIAEAGATRMLAQLMQYEVPMKHAKQLMEDALLIKPEMTPLEINPAMDGGKTLGTGAVIYEPIGVVAGITAYNFPFFLNLVKIFHALTLGNTMVLKPSPFTPFEALLLGRAADAAGLPKGVLNIINGDNDAGILLSTDKRVDMVSFTGSDKVGASIISQTAPTLKKTHMELGGKSALIVRSDADIEKAAMDGLAGFTIHSGQGCALTTRHLVHNSVRKAYVATLKTMIEQIKVGNPADPEVGMGPLIRASARERVEKYVAKGVDSGATLAFGGKRPAELEKGFYFEPTFFDNVDNSSALAQEEVFGPVAAVIGFDTDEEAIAIANDSDYGLSGSIYSRDAGTAYEIAQQLRTGGVSINGGAGTMLSSAPFGGYKRSGIGREYGRAGLLEFTEVKSIAFHAG